ncbi:sigma-70 family RNA polymerase sigma factor [soil metagenome]
MGSKLNLMVGFSDNENLKKLIQGCIRGERVSQKLLYEEYFGYALSICIRYCKSKDEAYEVLNDGFMKIFTKLNMYDADKPFKFWLRRIMINTSLDHYRRNLKFYNHQGVDELQNISEDASVLQEMAYNEIISMIQQLPPAYRMVFNLAVIDGYKHEEIADILSISAGTSKSNLFKAREKLKVMFKQSGKEEYAKFS